MAPRFTSTTLTEIEAPHGQKMIEVTLRFWTNDIAPTEGKIIPKHMHDSGMMKISVNDVHGITDANPTPFKLRDLQSRLQELFEAHDIIVHF